MAAQIYKKVSTDLEIRNAKPADKRLLLGNGLTVEISQTGRKTFYFSLRGVYKSLGVYPDIKLAQARELASNLRASIKKGETKPIKDSKNLESFRESAEIFFDLHKSTWTPNYRDDVYGYIREFCDGSEKLGTLGCGFGDVKTSEITKADFLPIINGYVSRGSLDSVRKKVMGILRRVLEGYNARQDDLKKRVILDFLDLKEIQKSLPRAPKRRHHPALDHDDLPAFFEQVIKVSPSSEVVRYALLFTALSALRISSVVHIKITDINFEKREIIIPGQHMKMKEDFWVPLTDELIILIQRIQRDATFEESAGRGTSEWLFPGQKYKNPSIKDVPLNPATARKMINELGYKGRQSQHGFRTNFSSWANSRLRFGPGWTSAGIEAALDHRERSAQDRIKSAYDWRYELKEERILN
jgi:integrase